MQGRLTIRLALAATIFAALALVPASAMAQPRGAHRVTIKAAPNPALAGDAVVIYGKLFGRNHGGQRVSLYHEVAPANQFTLVQVGRTDSTGAYQFNRLPGVVDSNRRWFVVSAGAVSRIVNERVEALVKLDPPAQTNDVTGVPYTFTGTVDPAHVGDRVELQRQNAAGGDDWGTIDHGRILAGGRYSITHRFTVPGDANIRVLLRADRRNIKSPSEPVALQIQQNQKPAMTIASSSDPLTAGGSTSISGVLAAPSNAAVQLTLLARTDTTKFAPVAFATTDALGNYSFAPQAPINNTFYKVIVTGTPSRESAVLYEGVKDVVTATASANSITVGQSVTFSGGVTPNKTGHVLYLQRLERDGDFHTVQSGRVGGNSQYTLTHRIVSIGNGNGQFRILVPGGPVNQGGASPTIAIAIHPNTTALS